MDTPRFGNGPAWDDDPHFHVVTHPNRILIATCDRQGRVDHLGPQWSALTGIDRAALLGFGWLTAVHASDQAALRQTLAEAAAASAAFRQRLRLRRHDGTHLAMVVDGQPRFDASGALAGYVLACLDVSHHNEDELEFDIAEERLVDLIRQSRLPGVVLDTAGRVVFLNEAFATLTGRTAAEIRRLPLAAALGLGDGDALLAGLFPDGRQAADFPSEFATPVHRPDGSQRMADWHAIALREFCGRAKGCVLLGADVTQQVEAERRLQLTHRVFETTDQAMVITDERGTILSVNQAFTRLTGYSAGEAIGRNPRILQSGRHDAAFYAAMWQSIRSCDHWHGDIWDRRKDGSVYPKFLSICAIRDDHGKVTNYSGIFYDISERKNIEEQLDRLAHYDALTGLANRVLFFDHAESALSLARRSDHQVALLFLDLDHFKDINDKYGHDAGDELLKVVAERLRRCIRRHDTAARFGGDEFVLLLPEISDRETAAHVGRKVLAEVSQAIEIAGRPCAVTPSIGVSLYPSDAASVEVMLRHADRAMYAAKAAGRAAMKFFSDGEESPR